MDELKAKNDGLIAELHRYEERVERLSSKLSKPLQLEVVKNY